MQVLRCGEAGAGQARRGLALGGYQGLPAGIIGQQRHEQALGLLLGGLFRCRGARVLRICRRLRRVVGSLGLHGALLFPVAFSVL